MLGTLILGYNIVYYCSKTCVLAFKVVGYVVSGIHNANKFLNKN